MLKRNKLEECKKIIQSLGQNIRKTQVGKRALGFCIGRNVYGYKNELESASLYSDTSKLRTLDIDKSDPGLCLLQ